MQIPILVAIMEYVLVLATKKYGNHIEHSKIVQVGPKSRKNDLQSDFDSMAKICDKWTFIVCFIFIIIFTIIYCIVAHKVSSHTGEH